MKEKSSLQADQLCIVLLIIRYLLAADTKADRATWIDSLNEALRDSRAWLVDEKKPLYPDLSRMHNQDVYMCSKVDV